MKLQRQMSRRFKGKEYDKWVITIPPKIIEKLGWKEGEELVADTLKEGIFVRPSKVKNGGEYIVYKLRGKLSRRTESRLRRFVKVYNNLPLDERFRVIVYVDEEPITWKVANKNIIKGTKTGKKILRKLDKLELI